MIGQSLGRYQIESKLGEGGMGVVFKARDTQLERLVAIKVLPPDKLADPDRKRRFIQEAKAASALNHPAIVTIHDFAESDGQSFIVMEFVPGQTLDRLIPANGMPLAAALKYGAQVADGLSKAHEAGILHRDIKPSNILITDDGRAKILDFGVAKLIESEEAGATTIAATEPGAVVGTTAYMSPEQAEGKRLDLRSDVFSLGSVLYEMITGERAFTGDSRLSVMRKIVADDPPPPTQTNSAIPADVEKVILRALRKDPARRFQSMADLRVALEDLSTDAAVPVARVREGSSRRWIWIAAATAIAIVSFVLPWRRGPEPVSNEPLHAVPLTALAGTIRTPSLSPDGAHVVYRWSGPNDDNADLYVQQIGVSAPPLRLTTAADFDHAPSWSPDGRAIAFLRGGQSGGAGEVRLVPPLGGPERKIADLNSQLPLYRPPSIAWCPDSSCVVASDSASPGDRSLAIVSIAIDTGERRQLTFSSGSTVTDLDPRISPDGRWLLFRRDTTPFTGDYYRLPMQGRASAGAETVRLTFSRSAGDSPDKAAWTPDSRAIIFSARSALWRADALDPGERARLPFVGEDGRDPSLAATRDGSVRMVYVRLMVDSNLWRLTLPAPGAPATSAPQPIERSPRYEQMPNLSPDGRRLLFLSNRSGHSEFWAADADGGNMMQLTTLTSLPGFGRWSPDGSLIAFHSDPQGRPDILVMPAQGGPPRTITANFDGGGYPSFSRDGRWIYYSNVKDRRIWKIATSGGEPAPVTSNEGSLAIESADGRDLYYLDHATPASLWRQPLSGGPPAKLFDGVVNLAFDVVAGGIYYLDRASPDKTLLINQSRSGRLQYYDFATSTTRTVASELGAVNLGLSVSADGRTIYFSRADTSADELMLVDKFR